MGKTATTASTRKASTPASESASGASQFRQHGWADKAFQYTMAGLLVGAVSVMSLVSPDFRDPDNLVNILQQNAIIGVVACGMTLMIIAGGFDLSVGSVAAAAGVTSASLSLRHGFVVSVIVGLLVGLLVGQRTRLEDGQAADGGAGTG